MLLYRIVKTEARTTDLSGTGAFRLGGRWNNKGTYMLYTSENSSLALLETLVHFEETEYPPNLYIMQIEVSDKAPIHILKDADYPPGWMQLELLQTKAVGDRLMKEAKAIGIKVKSAVNQSEYNYLLNPLFPNFHSLVKVASVSKINLDERLVS